MLCQVGAAQSQSTRLCVLLFCSPVRRQNLRIWRSETQANDLSVCLLLRAPQLNSFPNTQGILPGSWANRSLPALDLWDVPTLQHVLEVCSTTGVSEGDIIPFLLSKLVSTQELCCSRSSTALRIVTGTTVCSYKISLRRRLP